MLKNNTGPESWNNTTLEDIFSTESIGKRSPRWHRLLLKFYLTIYNTSSSSFRKLKKILWSPSESTLKRYRHYSSTEHGWNACIPTFAGKLQEQVKLHGDKALIGIFSCDETSIADGLVYKKSSGELIGFTSWDADSTKDVCIATNILQFSWRGMISSFNVPLSHYATSGLEAPVLANWFWAGVVSMSMVGAWPLLFVCDGLGANRKFIRDACGACAVDNPNHEFILTNPVSHLPLVFMSDPEHVTKKHRNNAMYSQEGGKRDIKCKIQGVHYPVRWFHLRGVLQRQQFDHTPTTRLTIDHLDIKSHTKMKSSLAYGVFTKSVIQSLIDNNLAKKPENKMNGTYNSLLSSLSNIC